MARASLVFSRMQDSGRLKKELGDKEVSVMWMTVGLFNQYAEELREEFGRMRYLIVGGDALDAGVMRRLVSGEKGEGRGRRKKPEHVVNGYGPTETTTFALTYEMKEVGEREKRIPIGKPIGNTRVYVVDEELEAVGVGVVEVEEVLWAFWLGTARKHSSTDTTVTKRDCVQ